MPAPWCSQRPCPPSSERLSSSLGSVTWFVFLVAMRIGGPGHPTCAPPAERQEITEVPALGCHSCAQRSAAEPRGNPGRWYSGCTAVPDQGRQARDPPTDHRERKRHAGQHGRTPCREKVCQYV